LLWIRTLRATFETEATMESSVQTAIRAGRPPRAAGPHRARVVGLLALVVLWWGLAAPGSSEAQIVRPFALRFTTSAPGDIVIVPTFNSSRADLVLPAGSTVAWAGLYWFGAGVEDAPDRDQVGLVLLDTPALRGYVGIQASALDTLGGTAQGDFYSAFAEVTQLVQAGGNGTYTVANVQAGLDDNRAAGWALVVVYANPAELLRNLTVFDGLGNVSDDDPIQVTVSGFRTPPAGPFSVKLGAVAAEGDLGLTGDSFRLNGITLSDPANPASNFFNSSVSRSGVLIAAREPSFPNLLGFDADVGDVPGGPGGVLANGATEATGTFTSSGDQYLPFALTFAIEVFQPVIDPQKAVRDENGGALFPGEVLEYTVDLANTGNDPATGVVLVDPIPDDTTYLPGSLEIVSGPGAGLQSDAAGDDQAEFLPVLRRVVFRLGTGADAQTGGTLGIGEATRVRFRVTVNPGTPALTLVANQGQVTFASQTTGGGFDVLTDGDPDLPGDQPATIRVLGLADVSLAKSGGPSPVTVGGLVLYSLTATNQGPAQALRVTITDTLPVGARFFGALASAGGQCLTPPIGGTGTIVCSWAGLTEVGGTRTALVLLQVDPAFTGTTLTNQGRVANLTPDPDLSNNVASGTVEVIGVVEVVEADLRVTKRGPARAQPGGTVQYALVVTNLGPSDAQAVELQDPTPPGLSFVSATTPCTAGFPCPLGTVPVGATVPVVVTYQVLPTTGPGPITNTTTVLSPVTPDPVLENNTASASTLIVVPDPEPGPIPPPTPGPADLVAGKTASPLNPPAGTPVTFTVTATNLGPDSAIDVTIQDPLPFGTTFVSATPTPGGTCTTPAPGEIGGTVTCLWPGPTAVGEARAVTLVVGTAGLPTGDLLCNQAEVTSASDDPVPGNNVAFAAPVVFNGGPSTDIRVDQAALPGGAPGGAITAALGGVVVLRVQVTNLGPLPATAIRILDLFPDGLDFLGAVVSQGTVEAGTAGWSVGPLPVGGVAVADVAVRPIAVGLVRNTVGRLSSQPPDANAANDLSTISIAVTAPGP
jgi:uncharacterized repeat protein (TIGR01451 family)